MAVLLLGQEMEISLLKVKRELPCWQHLISFQKIIFFSIFDARVWEWGVPKAQVSFACTPHQDSSGGKQEALSLSSCPGSGPAGLMEQPRLSSTSGGEEPFLLLHSGWFNSLLLLLPEFSNYHMKLLRARR